MTAEEYARRILPELVKVAKARETITYGELAPRIGTHHRPLAHGLGYIRDHWCDPEGIPQINVLVVNKGTHVPGASYLPTGTHGQPFDWIWRDFEARRDEVWAYQGWDALLKTYGLD